jgi:hypothetical protein
MVQPLLKVTAITRNLWGVIFILRHSSVPHKIMVVFCVKVTHREQKSGLPNVQICSVSTTDFFLVKDFIISICDNWQHKPFTSHSSLTLCRINHNRAF